LATALLNPHRSDDSFPFKGLASCGVAFYLAAALRTRLRILGHEQSIGHEPRSLLDLVALGTIADMVPLVEENRILASAGLKELAKRERPGVAALASESGISPGPLSATDVSFRLAPRLNAAGRIGDAQVALDLFLAENHGRARELAATLEALNRDRRVVQDKIWDEALIEANRWENAPALVLGAEGWHQGVVGIVAAKLVERFHKPAVVMGFTNGQGRGSARTVGGFNLYQSLSRCRQHLDIFGGHAVAAGLSLPIQNLSAFREAFSAIAAEHFQASPRQGTIEVDTFARLSELDVVQAEELDRMGPFGNANPDPLLVLEGIHTRSTRIVGGSHLQLTLADGANTVDAIAFGMGSEDPGQGASLVALGIAEIDEFRGYRRPRFRLRHLIRKTT
jgi:single-stranded-DNA-specific exonuclease